ncbi:MAG: hypothetical protein QNJ88_13210 [Acidimicrobiia bacterium]|nr:hypothetical protein [Acidimicrobiia bacterium]
MNTPEHVFALFIEANPVADPDQLDVATESEGEIVHDVERDVLTEKRRPVNGRGGVSLQRGWKPAMVAASVVLLVGVIGLGALVFNATRSGPVAAESAVMEVFFDGEACTYTGPTELLPGNGVMEFERAPGTEPVVLYVHTIVGDDVGMDELLDWAATHPARAIPPWLGRNGSVLLEDGATSMRLPFEFTEGRYGVSCNTSPNGTDRVFVGAILSVTPG